MNAPMETPLTWRNRISASRRDTPIARATACTDSFLPKLRRMKSVHDWTRVSAEYPGRVEDLTTTPVAAMRLAVRAARFGWRSRRSSSLAAVNPSRSKSGVTLSDIPKRSPGLAVLIY